MQDTGGILNYLNWRLFPKDQKVFYIEVFAEVVRRFEKSCSLYKMFNGNNKEVDFLDLQNMQVFNQCLHWNYQL